MGLSCEQKFWIENFADLFCSSSLIPLNDMKLEEQMNAVTRLVFLIFLIMLITGFKYAVVFIVVSLATVILLYFIKRKKMDEYTESFEHTQTDCTDCKIEYYRPTSAGKHLPVADATCHDPHTHDFIEKPTVGIQVLPSDKPGLHLPSSQRFCNDQFAWNFNDPNFVSQNQLLVGKPNPKTMVKPVVVPPCADLSYWKANNLVTHSHVNEETQFDAYASGYQVSNCCGYVPEGTVIAPLANQDPYEVAIPSIQGMQGLPTQLPEYTGSEVNTTPLSYHGNAPGGQAGQGGLVNTAQPQSSTVENFEFPYLKTAEEVWPTQVLPEQPGQVNTACGYDPDQLFTAGLPTNMAVGNCQKDPAMRQYNDDMYTQTLQPNVYTRSQINEPINSMMGISFTQQYPPTTCGEDPDTGRVDFLQHDPRLMEPAIAEPNFGVIDEVGLSNLYDPRHTGYGTSYRSYIDPVTGQPRFFYKDIDAVKMPNYITRNEIDFTPFGDSYGPAPADGAWGNPWNKDIRSLAQDTWLRSNIGHRNDITERATHKMQVRAAQLRRAPMSTMNSGGAGNCGSCK